MSKYISTDRTLRRKGVKVLFLSLLTLVGIVVMQIIGYIVSALLFGFQEGLATLTMSQGVCASSAMLGMVVLGGATWLKASREDASHMLRVGWPIIVADILALIVAFVSFAIEGAAVAPDWLPNLCLTMILCLGIGIYEECVFRGIILNGLLGLLGKSHRGTLVAVSITSLLFGLVHVDVSADFADGFLATQAILKMVQTGLFSVILCGVVLRTHRMGGVSVFHGLTDFLLMVPSLVLAGDSLSTDYAVSGEDGVAVIVVYLVAIAIYLPVAVKTLRSLHRDQVAYRGAFMEKTVDAQEKASQHASDLPLPPAPRLADAA